MKQIDFKQAISVPKSDIRGMFEVQSVSANNGIAIKLMTGGTVNSFLPTNLINPDGSLISFTTSKGARWYLTLKGTLSSGQVTSCTLNLVSEKPQPPQVTPYMPPSSFEFVIYAGIGSSVVRTIGPSPTLKTVIMYKTYVTKYDAIGSNYVDYYTVTFS